MNCSNFDLITFSPLASITGGKIKYYTIEEPEAKQSFEKLHYDFSKILTKMLYYDVSFASRCSKEIEILNTYVGQLTPIKGSTFNLSACDSDYSYCFTYKIKEQLSHNKRIYFQIVVLFTDSFGQQFLRVFNYSVIVQRDYCKHYCFLSFKAKIYSNIDVDVLTKLTLMKEISENYNTDFKNVSENLDNLLINMLWYYRKKVRMTEFVSKYKNFKVL